MQVQIKLSLLLLFSFSCTFERESTEHVSWYIADLKIRAPALTLSGIRDLLKKKDYIKHDPEGEEVVAKIEGSFLLGTKISSNHRQVGRNRDSSVHRILELLYRTVTN